MDQNAARNVPSQTESIAPSLIAFSAVFLLLSVVIVALRFYVRLGVIRKFGTDDVALALTLVSLLPTQRLFGTQRFGVFSDTSAGVNRRQRHRGDVWYVCNPGLGHQTERC
jgi:hypothetical protein